MWTKGTTYPAAQENVLKLPFSLVLPDDLPPSYDYRKKSKAESGVVAYSVEVVGVRAGRLRFNKRIAQSFPLLPSSVPGAQLRDTLRLGWAGKMDSAIFSKKVRKGMWGDYANINVTVSTRFSIQRRR